MRKGLRVENTFIGGGERHALWPQRRRKPLRIQEEFETCHGVPDHNRGGGQDIRYAAFRTEDGDPEEEGLDMSDLDQLGVEVRRPRAVETTALGAAFLAGLGVGTWTGFDELRATWSVDRAFTPTGDRATADRGHGRWTQAVERARGWTS